MTKQTYRFIILLLTGLLALVITWGISFSQDNSEELVLPNSLENIYPLPYDQVPQQASLEIDLPVGYQLTLIVDNYIICLLYTSPSPRDLSTSRMPSSA